MSKPSKNLALGLPTLCPSWCEGPKSHRQALEEGTGVEWARQHMSDDLGGAVHDISNYIAKRLDRPGHGGWTVRLVQDYRESHNCTPVVRLEVHTGSPREDGTQGFSRETLNLTTSEARTLAAQLIHLADLDELHRWDGR